ncbi:helicase-exonuclease AddAB subunit AddB [Paenibacillus turpanensis]|uniref:helicase-exonuclease AddAB subunit AddB n=1 Tax=Paenibacillus turpanensis TaxID=2689078 RepID=UPI00140D53F4|nr:helicase-exonuclease AddAB subunit AddB [Paenibacillus turpanensis]
MAVRFIIGRSGSGKTERCLSEIRDRLREKPDGGPLIFLVPEQATFQADYALVSNPETAGVLRAQSLSFRRLAFRVMQETGGTAATYIDDTGKKMLLYKLFHRKQKELKLFRGTSRQAGFIDKLNDMFNEFKRYRVGAKELLDYAQEADGHGAALQDKLSDISLLYEDFEQSLKGLYVDSEDYLAHLAEGIPHSPSIRESEIWLDGFNGFTPQELAVVEQLFVHCRSVTVSLCVDREYRAGEQPDELELFHPTAVTMRKLNEMIDERGVTREPALVLKEQARHTHSPVLAHVEQGYGRRTASAFTAVGANVDSELALRAALNRRVEVEAAAREILRLAAENGRRFRDFAVLVRNAEAYEDYISAVFTDYGIPYFMDQKRSVLHHPLAELIRSALETVTGYWRYDAVFRAAKTELLFPQEAANNEEALEAARTGMDALENYVLAFGIQGSRWTDDRPWTYTHSAGLEEQDEQSRQERNEAFLQKINTYRRWIAGPLGAFERKLKGAKTVRDMAAALYAMLEGIQVPERLEAWSAQCEERGEPEKAREHGQMWDRIVDLFDQIVEMAGDDELPLEWFAGMVETGLESIKLGLVPPSLDQVLVGSLERSKTFRIKHLFLLGVNDGVLPAKGAEGGSLFSEPERETLAATGLELAPGARRKLLDEQYLIYTALSAAEERLWLSYPLADEEGRGLLPSEVIRRVKQLVPGVQEKLLAGEPNTWEQAAAQLPFIAHPKTVLPLLLAQLRKWKAGESIHALWWSIYNWYCMQPDWREELRLRVRSLFYTNEESPLSGTSPELLYGGSLTASISRLERFAACPFSFFAAHGLRLQERRVYKLETPDIGQFYHAALHAVLAELARRGIDLREVTEEQYAELAAHAVEQLIPRLQNEILLSSKRHGYISRRLREVVSQTAAVLGKQAGYGEFVPAGLELQFGRGGHLPALELPLEAGRSMQLEGRIDRVDRAVIDGDSYLRVIDYKSSSRALSLAEVYYGLSLQLLAYLDAAVTHAQSWLGEPARAAGVLYFHVHYPMLKPGKAIGAESAKELLFKTYKMRGLLLEHKEVIEKMDGTLESGYSEVIPVRLKKDGGFAHGSSVAPEKKWNELRTFVRKKMSDIGSNLLSGNVEIAPYRLGNKTACSFCPYKPVCQFDRLMEGNDYRNLSPVKSEQIWEHVEKEAERDDIG